jgi:uncharacterized protein YceH (UPF0502 family)
MSSSYRLDRQEQALLCTLMLRGPQTLGELRTNTGRMAEFADLPAVAEAVRRLTDRDTPLITQLAHLPGRREDRFAHLLGGTPLQDAPSTALAPGTGSKSGPAAGRPDPRDDRIATLEAQVATLHAEIEALWDLTGLSDRRPPNRD